MTDLLDPPVQLPPVPPAHEAIEEHGHDEHHGPTGILKWITTTDHKVIGIQYGLTSLVFLFFGFSLMMLMRWQLAYPGKPLPIGFLVK